MGEQQIYAQIIDVKAKLHGRLKDNVANNFLKLRTKQYEYGEKVGRVLVYQLAEQRANSHIKRIKGVETLISTKSKLSIVLNSVNGSSVTQFILLGLSDDPGLQLILFIMFLLLYIFTFLGNFIIVVTVLYSSLLQTPMYFFLAQLSFLDLSFSNVFSPKILADLLSKKKTISLYGCFTQVYFFSACAGTEFFLLAVMAYDRYVAICSPLLYRVIMSKSLYVRLASASYIGGFLHSLIHVGCLFRLSFCGPDVINHFGCDYPVLLKLSCTDILMNDLLRFGTSVLIAASSLFAIVVSYSHIVATILRIRTTAGRWRAASTCISHFTSVFLFFGSCFFMEMLPNSSSSEQQYKGISLIPTVIIPALNPLIYSLRNNEVKEALRKIVHQITHFQS
ncbi:olfactory receptor 5AP2-like [Lissotriton helveticus]